VKTYTIIISEDQRKALHAIINANPAMTAENMPLEYWLAMLANLPKDETESPEVIHGFCL